MNTVEYSQFLREHGIRPSLQRLAIYDYLWKNRTHPTADEIFHALSPMISTLSKTTVYNTLRLFATKGAVSMVTIEEKEMRFDAKIEIHGHFKCSCCGKLEDFEVDGDSLLKLIPAGSKVDSTHLYIYGSSADCLAKGN